MGNLQESWDPELFKEEIKRVVSRISRIDAAELEDPILIREELGVDSLMAMEIIATCERLLDVKIDEAKFADIRSVGDFLELLAALRRSRDA